MKLLGAGERSEGCLGPFQRLWEETKQTSLPFQLKGRQLKFHQLSWWMVKIDEQCGIN